MANFKVALVALDGETVPDWVRQRLDNAEVDLVSGECTSRADVIELGHDADALWVFGGSRVITADCLPELPRCIALLRTGTGTDNVPLAEASAAGIVVAITPEAGGEAVAEHSAALILTLLRQVATQARLVHSGMWDRFQAWPQGNVKNQTLGLIGFGSIARALVSRMRGFELSVVATDPYVGDEVFEEYGVVRRSLHEVLSSAQIVSLHCPLTPETHHLLGKAELMTMREDSVLINTARGPLVDQAALAQALSEGWISGAGLDVLEREPPDPSDPLLRLENVVITPHIAGYSNTFYYDSWRLSVDTLVDLARGWWPRACVNRDITPRRPLVDRPADGVQVPVELGRSPLLRND
ncbi:C-terminal binding protein [Tenggerimyces flavus]|uniref:C-terminal binding protein n=1 Tax=Tenggerimyces flavus TaxID=1708749 RepID=A0ABV7YJL9_9ACTN|nr:C-terminal binding protein [Tenggerimyces flavus]MBM7789613.1 D-3-phosphoglycerate dehydrogenase [Tenggerimyces flavus]